MMDIFDLSALLGRQIQILTRPHLSRADEGFWYAKLDHVDIVEGNFITDVYGNARTPKDSVNELARKLRGKVVRTTNWAAGAKFYTEIIVPPDLKGYGDG